MKLNVILLLFLLVTVSVNCQENKVLDTNKVIPMKKESRNSSGQLLDQYDHIPVFPGGDDKLFEFIARNLEYPRNATRDKIQGRVVLTFIVTETGKIDSISVLKGLRPDIDNSAISLVKKMPDWIPGTQNGKAARIRCTLPITFRLYIN